MITYYSVDDEFFTHDNLEDAVFELYHNLSRKDIEEGGVFTVYACEFKQVPVSYFYRDVVELIDDSMYEELGEHSDGIQITPEQTSELNNMIKQYLDKADPRMYSIGVGRSREIELTLEDILDVVQD